MSARPKQRRPTSGRPRVAEQDVLDEEEQEREIARLEQVAARQRRLHKALVGGAALLLAALYVAFALHQALAPWELLLHAELRDAEMTTGSVVVGLLGGALTVLVAAAAALTFRPRTNVPWQKLLNLSVTLAALEAAFWGTAIVKLCMQPGYAGWGSVWRLAWLPLTPAAWVGAVVVAINGLDRIGDELHTLRAAQYALKRA